MTAPKSQNGYPANDPSLVAKQPVPGTKVDVTVKRGDAGYLLLHLASWFDLHVEDIDNARGALDDWGYAERPIRGSATEISNHASGTAIDLNATKHPLGKRGTFTRAQTKAIRAQLKEYDGCIRWGGDYSGRADEMHFEIVRPLAACSTVARKLRAEEVSPLDAILTDLKALAKKHGVSLVYLARVALFGSRSTGVRAAAVRVARAALKPFK
jgi:hypothetical protein